MPASHYAVDCDLSLHQFDDARAGYAAAGGTFAEVQRLGRLDERVHATRMLRGPQLTVEISITVEASSWSEAFEVSRGLLRTAVHTIGGRTAGWEQLRPRVMPDATRSQRWRRRVRDRARRPAMALPATPASDWESVTAATRSRGMAPSWLPPLRDAEGRDLVIDLR